MSNTQHATERTPLIKSDDPRDSRQDQGPNEPVEADESQQQIPDREGEEPFKSTTNVTYILLILSIGAFLALLDQSVVAAISGDIGSDLGALRSVSWIATAYFLSMTCSQPLYGKLSDVFGRKPCLLFAYTMFGIGSLGCGLTGTMGGLIAARAIQGIGGGGVLIVATVLLSDLVSIRDRGTYQGYLNLIGAIGSTSGGPIGGFFAQSIGWRWLFFIQVFLCLLAILSITFLLRLPSRKTISSWRAQLRDIDFLGATLLTLCVSGLLFGLDRGTNVSWHSPVTLVPLCTAVPLLLMFLWVETKFAVQPFTPGHIIFDRGLSACYAQGFFGYAGFTALIFYLPLFFQTVLRMTPAQAGIGLIPAAISGVTGTFVGGIVLKRTEKYYWLAVISAMLSALASVPIAIVPSFRSGSLITICIASVATFVPQGIVITASLIAILSNVTAADQAVATACMFLFRSLGAAVGVSLVSLVIDQILGLKLRAALDPKDADQILGELKKSLDIIKRLPPELRVVVRDCYRSGIQSGFIMCSAFLASSALCVVLWRRKNMSD